MKHTDNGAFNSEHKVLLHQSIARYLKHSGFSKTLKKFRSEAQFEVSYIAEFKLDFVKPYSYA